MFRVQFKRDLFKNTESHRIGHGSHQCLGAEAPPQKPGSRHQKGQEGKDHEQRQVHPRELVDDDRDAGSAVIDGVIRDQDADDRKAGDQRTQDDHKTGKQLVQDLFKHVALYLLSQAMI